MSNQFKVKNGIIVSGSANIENNLNVTGSSKLGSTLNDTHQITGSLSISGSLNISGTTSINTVNNTAGDILTLVGNVVSRRTRTEILSDIGGVSTGSFNTYTSSNNTTNVTQNNRLNSIEITTGSLNSFTSSFRTDFNTYTSSNNTTNVTQNNRLNSIEISTSSLNEFTSSINTTIANIISSGSSISGSGTTNYIVKWGTPNSIGDSILYETGSFIGINTTLPESTLDIRSNSSTPNTLIIRNDDPTVNTGGTKLSFRYQGFETGYIHNFFDGGYFSSVINSSGYLGFNVGGNNRMRIDVNGNVAIGLGPTNATTRLHIDNITSYNNNIPNGGLVVSNLSAHNAILDVGVDSTYLGYIQSRNILNTTPYNLHLNPIGGNVLIGTTTDTGHKLQVNGTVSNLNNLIYSGGSLFLRDPGNIFDWALYHTNTNHLYFDFNGTNRLSINSSGNVGIGTTNPIYTLHLNRGNVETGILTSYGSNQVYLSHGGWNMGAGKFGIGNTVAPALVFDTNTNRIGIGTSTPSKLLHLKNNNPIIQLEKSDILNWNLGNEIGNDFYITNDVSTNRFRMTLGGNIILGSDTGDSGERLQVNGTSKFSSDVTLNANLNISGIGKYTSLTSTNIDTVLTSLSSYNGNVINVNPHFREGTVGYIVYNNSSNGSVTITTLQDINSPSASTNILRISYNGTSASPGYGGFYTAFSQRGTLLDRGYIQGNRYVYRIIAKIPVGRYIEFHTNLFGNNGSGTWLTDQNGSGTWKEYIYYQKIGFDGTLSSTSFFAVNGGSNVAFTWDVAMFAFIALDEPNSTDYLRKLNIGNTISAPEGGLALTNYLTTSSDILVGTTSPLLPNPNRGNITINGSSDAILTLGIGGSWYSYLYSTPGGTYLSSRNGFIDLETGGVGNRLRVGANGNILINTTTDSGERLNVNGNSRIGNIKIQGIDGLRIGFNRNTENGQIYNTSLPAHQIQSTSNGLEFQSYTPSGVQNGGLFFKDGKLILDTTGIDTGEVLQVAGTARVNGEILMTASTIATGVFGIVSSSWGGNSIASFPTLYSTSPERWIMHINPHISYTQLGINGYSGNMTGATIRFASDASASTYWDLGTGVNSVGTDKFSIGRSGGSLFAIDNAGRVGIGITNPTSKLQIVDGNQLIKFATGTNTSGYELGVGVNDDGINFTNNSTVRGFNFKNTNGTLFTINSNGNVGIDTTSPSRKLDVVGGHTTSTFRVYYDGRSSPGAGIASVDIWASEPNMSYDGSGIGANVNGYPYYGRVDTTSGQSYIRFINGITAFHNNTGDAMYAERLRITASGNILIDAGTDTGHKLQVNGDVRIATLNTGSDLDSIVTATSVGVLNKIPNVFAKVPTAGTVNRLVKFTGDGRSLGDSVISDVSGTINISTTSFPGLSIYRDLNVNEVGPAGQRILLGAKNQGIHTAASAITSTLLSNGQNGGLSFEVLNNSILQTYLTITASGNVLIGTTTDTGHKLQVNGDGRFTGNVTAPNFLGNASSSYLLTASGTGLTTQHGDGMIGYSYALFYQQAGLFPGGDNSNAIITINRHPGDYYSQLGFSSNGNLYYRSFTNTPINTTQAWRTIIDSSNIGSQTVAVSELTNTIRWRNYGEGHVIFDASAGITPGGTSVSNVDSHVGWAPTYPTLMGWNGSNTFGVRVDRSRVSDVAAALATARNINGVSFNGSADITLPTVNLSDSQNVTGNKYFKNLQSFSSPLLTNVSNNQYDWQNSPITIRERGEGSSMSGSDLEAPNLNFHWGARATKSIWLDASGRLKFGTFNVFEQVADSTFMTGKIILNTGTDTGETLQVNGTIKCTTITETSSRRYKDNIIPIENSLDKITKLQGVTYTRKDTNNTEYGLIAEEVYDVLPELVNKNLDGEIESISYGRITSLLIESIKEQQKQIEEQQKQINKLIELLNGNS